MKPMIAALALCGAILAACSDKLPIHGQPKDVTRSAGFETQDLRGFHPLTIRAYDGRVADINEVTSAQCHLRGRGYQIAFVAPARISLPLYGKHAAAPQVTCHHAGRSASVKPRLFNESESEIFRGMIAGSGFFGPKAVLVAAVVAAGVVAVRPGQETDDYIYRSAWVVFNRPEPPDTR